MNTATDPIFDIACAELLISCQVDECQNLLAQTLEQPATDPIDVWAKLMSKHAHEAGWSSDADGRVLCPQHAHLGKQVNT
jgi:hypothetical protein